MTSPPPPLAERVNQVLDAEAEARGVSRYEIMREAIDLMLAQSNPAQSSMTESRGPISEEALAELERLDKERTQGEWVIDDGGVQDIQCPTGGRHWLVAASCGPWIGARNANRAFIVAAANAFPSLISELRSLRERETEFKSRCDSADALLAAAKNFAGGWYFESVDPKCVTEAEAIEGEINAFFAYAPDPRSQDTGETG